MRFPALALVVAGCLAGAATAGAGPRQPAVREEVTVSRVQVDAVIVPREGGPRSCREIRPGDLVARVGGREWAVEAIDWDGTGFREERRLEAGKGCLRVAVYLGTYAPAVPLDCPGDPHMREAAPFEPPAGDLHPGYGTDVTLAARRIVEEMRPCDRVALFREEPGKMVSTRWVADRERALSLLEALVSGRTPRGGAGKDLLVRPWRGGWEGIVPALGAVPGHKDLVVIGGDDLVQFSGEDPWRIADLAEEARRARVTIHRVDPVPGGRVGVPGSADALATGGLVLRGGARARVLEEVRRQAYCRARVTLVPPPGASRARQRAVSLASRTGRFDVRGTSWLVEPGAGRTDRLAAYLEAGEGDRGLAVEVAGVDGCTGRPGGALRCEARVVVRPSGPRPVEPGAAGIALWRDARPEYSRVYGLAAGGPVRAPRRIRLPFTARRGRRTLCVMVFGREGTFLGSACRGVVIPPPVVTARAR